MKVRLAVLCVMLALVPTATSCARGESASEGEEHTPETPPAVPDVLEPAKTIQRTWDQELPGRLRTLHQAVDRADSDEERVHAADELLRMFEETGNQPSPHLISVRQDLAARAATLLIKISPERAKVAAEKGLQLSESPSILRANLLLALADAEEALGREAEAKKALLQALAVNETLFESELKSP